MRILFATDGSENSLAAARLLAGLSLGATDVIAVLSVASGTDSQPAVDAVNSAVKLLPSDPTHLETIVRGSHPADEILRTAAELPADLLVLGARGHNGLATLLSGSVSDQVLRQAHCPVLLARSMPGALRRVLLGTDGSAGAARAADYLCSLPLPSDCEIRVLTLLPAFDQIAREHMAVGPPLTPDVTTLAELQRREAQEHLDAVAETLKSLGRTVVTEIRGTDPAEGLLATACEEGTDLLVIGTHTQSRVERFFLGSVSESLAHQAPCSILVVR